MDGEIWKDIIVGVITLVGVLISNNKAQAVTDVQLKELTREVREHNNFAQRVPVLEEKVSTCERRITDLEKEE